MPSVATKRKSRDNDDALPNNEEARTPTNSPPRKKPRITRSQKQALIDNLQLEITERARKLRAQYALQAHDLRGRIERRINRIPLALRKANMGELLEKHNNALRNPSPKKYRSPAKGSRNFTTISSASARKKMATASPSPRRARKQSPEGIYSDKENAPATEQLDVLKNPKRRAKPGAAVGTSRVVSQEVRGNDYRILSPKSSNSRTYPQSPLRASPEKPQPSSYLSRPMSPLKPSSPLKSASASVSANSGRATSTKTTVSSTKDNRPPSQAKRPASRAATATARSIRSPLSRPATRQAERRGSISSASSGTSAANPRTGAASRKATATSTTTAVAAKRAAASRSQAPSAAAKRSTASGTKKIATAAGGDTTAGRRVLRKRA